ncbi:MAG: DUF4412 domain-containing protein [Cyclobacteriaceae bacterium]|nr:DUF4412 domain-containing protein [Cyclobacteriaceae bacterium]
MKRLLLSLVLICTSVLTQAQSFEGIITWTSKSDIKLSDEQVQQMKAAKKQLEAQMNNPEFKKQMDANPALKEMMEKQLKNLDGMQGGGAINFMPEKMVTKVKGKNTRSEMGTTVFIYRGDQDKTWSVDTENKTYSEIKSTPSESTNGKLSVTKTTETATINGYNCTKYLMNAEGSAMPPQWIWVTKDIKDIDPALFKRSGNENLFIKDIDGIPVKIEMNTPQGKMTMEMTELKRVKLPDSDFQIPAGYSKK